MYLYTYGVALRDIKRTKYDFIIKNPSVKLGGWLD